MSEDTQDPTLADVIVRAVAGGLGRVRVAMDGRVVSYNRDTQSAVVTPLVEETVVDASGVRSGVALPDLEGVQIRWPSGGGVSLTWDLTEGDLVLLVFRDRSHDEIDAGDAGTSASLPSSGRRFNVYDVVGLPMGNPLASALPAASVAADAVVLRVASASGEIRLGDSTASKALALAEKVKGELDAIDSAFSSHTHAFGYTGSGNGSSAQTGTTDAGPTYTPADVDSERVFADK